jgi:hypothetical protein
MSHCDITKVAPSLELRWTTMNKPIVDHDIYPVEGSKNLLLDRYHGPTFLSTSMPFNMTMNPLVYSRQRAFLKYDSCGIIIFVERDNAYEFTCCDVRAIHEQ